jgi:FkbM family methyltransferase
VLKLFGDLYAILMGWPAAARLNRAFFYLSSRALGFHNYSSASISGETRVVNQCVSRTGAPVIFDVGANNGDWSALVLKTNKLAKIHAFEPQPALASHMAKIYPIIAVNNLAVGEAAGELDLYDYADHPGSQHASLLKGVIDTIHGGIPRVTKVSVVTLDDYCRNHRVDFIDFLKIDVEGFELAVLRGAREMLASGKIAAIQFEFNEMNVTGRTFLSDFMNYLGSAYSVYRILPHGVLKLVRDNHWHNEQFAYQNLLAVKIQIAETDKRWTEA